MFQNTVSWCSSTPLTLALSEAEVGDLEFQASQGLCLKNSKQKQMNDSL